MLDVAILDKVALGYAPFILPDRSIPATQLSVLPLRAGYALDVSEFMQVIGEVWPPTSGQVSLRVVSEKLLHHLLRVEPSPNVMLEVPNFMASDPANLDAIVRLHRSGNVMLLKGRPTHPLPRELLACFRHAIVDFHDDHRVRRVGYPEPVEGRRLATMHSGVTTFGELEASFASGSHAVIGWPLDNDGAPARIFGKPMLQGDVRIIVELIRQVDRGEAVSRLETTLKRDASLAYKVLKYMNSALFGLRVEVSSFRQAIMLLGYEHLKRWLALLLTTASSEPNAKPGMFASIRRGLIMEDLYAAKEDEKARSEAFMCGMFSLLDQLFGEDFETLFADIPVPDTVIDALVHHRGPLHPYLMIAQTTESGSPAQFLELAGAQLLEMAEINRALLRALLLARSLSDPELLNGRVPAPRPSEVPAA